MNNENKSSAQLEREVQEQRNRVEARIEEIKDRLSPGQLLDEALSYTKNGGAHFASNLGQQISANPMPAALVGIGLAWLISSSRNGSENNGATSYRASDSDYPYASIASGGLRRTSHAADETGQWWSEFESDAGDTYKVRSTQTGERAGHFVDKAGRIFSGFIDGTGNRVRDFRDEAGNVLADAQSWANHSWHDLQQGVAGALGSARSAAKNMMGSAQSGTVDLNRQVMNLFDQQPLIAGALAFAAGAALGATLPHTDQEDQLLGSEADRIKRKATRTAGKLYEEGKERAAELYEEVSGKAGQIYSDAKSQVTGTTSGYGDGDAPSRH